MDKELTFKCRCGGTMKYDDRLCDVVYTCEQCELEVCLSDVEKYGAEKVQEEILELPFWNPEDCYFESAPGDDDETYIYISPIQHWDQKGCLPDTAITPASDDFWDVLNNIPGFDGMAMDSTWLCLNTTREDVDKVMIAGGFQKNEEFTAFLKGCGNTNL